MKYKLIFGIIFSGVFLISACEKETEAAGHLPQTTTAITTATETTVEKIPEITEETVLTAAKIKSDKFFDNVKHLGRTYISEDTIWCVLSGTGAEFTANGKQLVITLQGGNAASKSNNEKVYARVAVYVNDERLVDTQVDEETKVIDVPLNPDEPSTVKIIKLSEAMQSIFGISGITVDGGAGKISPVPENDFLIEFVGDSVTCGYGVDAPDQSHKFSTETEDFTDTYAYLAAESLGADYSIIAYSGHGIISGYTASGVKQPASVVPKYYGKIGNSSDRIGGTYPVDIDWDFSSKPDLIVVNLGANDESYCGDDLDRQAEYIEKYIEFIEEIRRVNPDAFILCSLGVLGDRLCPCVEEAVKRYSEKTGDKNLDSLRFEVQIPDDGYGADWHPSAATHQKMAKKLTDWINANIKK
ncbi:MAG: GDSL-type esterase/lipase family protein [Ruminococcus sp.]|jgi:lysophospholipase L1-like esterase|nr:GDSL-type esterase/lipase family protein [Ruminococcus sp.]